MYVDTLGAFIPDQFKAASDVWIAVGLMNDKGIEYLRLCKGVVNILVGIDLPTPPSVLRFLHNRSENAEIRFKVYINKEHFFHPKLFIVKANSKLTAYVGSGNFTEGGMNNNIELFSLIDNQKECEALIKWFDLYFAQALVINETFITEYEQRLYKPNKTHSDEIRKSLSQFKANSHYETDFEQFFRQEHFNAFEGDKPTTDNSIAKSERKGVQHKLLELHDKLFPQIIANGWNLHPHKRIQNITSSYYHNPRVDKSLSGLWLYYGKSKDEIEAAESKYKSKNTPNDHVRLQTIVLKDRVGIWCAIGKDNGSRADRIYLNDKIQRKSELDILFSYIKRLDNDYFILVNDVETPLANIDTAEKLYEIINQDIANLDKYFIIGLDIYPNDKRLSEDEFIQFVLQEFEKLYPIYEFVKIPV